MTITSLDTVVEWFDRVWTHEDASAIDELFVPDGLAHGLGSQTMHGPEEFKLFHKALLGLVTNVRISVDKSITEGDWTSLICTVTAKGRKQNQDVHFTGSILIRIVNGMIVEGYNHFDFLTMFGQLGLMPERAFEEALASGLDC